MTTEQKLQKLGIDLPAAPAPVGAYVAAVRVGNLVFTAGQLPMKDGQLIATGKVAAEAPLEQAQAAARQACLNALSVVRAEIGSLDAVARVVRLNVFVNSAAGFTDQAKVANGASELLVEIFGESGKHTRCAIGAAELPLNAPVELDLILEVKSQNLLINRQGEVMSNQHDWPEWWEWELELSLHLLRRMIKRQFNEADLRTMLTDATEYKPDVEPERWLISTKWHGKPWEIIVEPDQHLRRLVIITAYMVG